MSTELPPFAESRYNPLQQKRLCCVPANIIMIQQKHGIPILPQDELGYHLGLVVPDDIKSDYFKGGQDDDTDGRYGTQLQNPKYDFNVVSQKLKLGCG